MSNDTLYPFSSPFYIISKPSGNRCNMRCEYCYYLGKDKFYSDPSTKPKMSVELLEKFISEYILSQNSPNVMFCWHGGEATLNGREFFNQALGLQKKYGSGLNIVNTIQTNGLLLDDEWCEFFRKNNFLVGISLDGDRESNDTYRKNLGGSGTFDSVMRGIRLLQKHNVEFNILSTVNAHNVRRASETYEFFRSIGARYVQFTPVVERLDGHSELCSADTDGTLTKWSITAKQWGAFLCEIFGIWVKRDVGEFFVNVFDSTLAGYLGVDQGNCSLAKKCGNSAAMEHNGDVYSCDHFVFPKYLLGNINQIPLRQMMDSSQQISFGNAKINTLPACCRSCKYLHLCNGECPKNRIIPSNEKDHPLNFLCLGYKFFFENTQRHFLFMAQELREGRNVLAVRDLP